MSDRFAHRLRLDQIRDGERIDLVADEAELKAICERLDLPSIGSLEAHVTLLRNGEIVRAQGRLAASLEQCCVVTNQPVPAHVDEPFEILFMREPQVASPDDEIELGAADCDVVFYEGGAIDLGTAVADSLALSLDPYPRSAEAEVTLKEAGVLSEEDAGPFAALAQLRNKLGGSDS